MDLFKEAAMNKFADSDTDSGLMSCLNKRETCAPDLVRGSRSNLALKSIPVAEQIPIYSINAELSNCPRVWLRKDATLKKRNNNRRNTIAVNINETSKDDPQFVAKFAKSNNNIDSTGLIEIPNFNKNSVPGKL